MKNVYYIAQCYTNKVKANYVINHAIARFTDEEEARTFFNNYRETHRYTYVHMVTVLETV